MRKCAVFFAFLLCLAKLHSLEIYRPENYGALNTVPCLLRIADAEGNDATDCIRDISFSWYYDMQHDHKWTHRYYRGCFTGGTIIHLDMKPGVYRISVYTPADMQDIYGEQDGEAWQSNEFVYDTSAPALKVIFVSPTADDNGFYNGGWHVSHRAPSYYLYTKPLMPRK